MFHSVKEMLCRYVRFQFFCSDFFFTMNSVITLVTTLCTFHDSDWVLHLGSKDIWSKYSGEVLDTHLVLVAVGLDLIKESKERYQLSKLKSKK